MDSFLFKTLFFLELLQILWDLVDEIFKEIENLIERSFSKILTREGRSWLCSCRVRKVWDADA